MELTRLAETLVVGLASGVLSGLLGIGGGLVTTPAIRLILGYPALIAVGTPLAVIIPTTAASALTYSRRANVDWRAAAVLGGLGAAGSAVGALFTRYVGGSLILILTAVILVWAAYRLVVAPPGDALPRSGATAFRLVLLGIAAGLFSGFFGLGGGSVIVPGLVRWLGMPIRRAIGTSLVAITIIVIPGLIVHALLGHVDWGLALGLAVAVVPGAALGARIAHLGSERWLRTAFAVFMVLVAVALAASELARV